MAQTMSRLHQCLIYLPDSATAMDLLFSGIRNVLELPLLVEDILSLVDFPSRWYGIYFSTRLSFQALFHVRDENERAEKLREVQRELYTACFGGNASPEVSWELLFGIVQLMGELLHSPLLSPSERAQLRGTTTQVSHTVTLQLVAGLGGHQRWESVAAAARSVLIALDTPAHVAHTSDVVTLWPMRPSPAICTQASTQRRRTSAIQALAAPSIFIEAGSPDGRSGKSMARIGSGEPPFVVSMVHSDDE